MGDKLKNSMEWLSTQKLTPVQLIYIIVAAFYFIFTQTNLYDSIPDFAQTVIFVGIIVTGVLLGVSILNTKKLAMEMKAIYEDKNMSAEQKINAYGNLALIILTKLGQAFDLLNKEQGINTYKNPEPNRVVDIATDIETVPTDSDTTEL